MPCLTRRRDQGVHTNQTQPDELEPDNGQDGQRNPKRRVGVQGNPEEALVRRIDCPGRWLGALKYPMRLARRRIDFVPPSKTYETPPSDIFEVVEVGREE